VGRTRAAESPMTTFGGLVFAGPSVREPQPRMSAAAESVVDGPLVCNHA
jgi:hypothetical protein